jgi:SPX domain protein involved in polyphosphate accumulation
MKDSMLKDLTNVDWPSAARSKAIKFPHAILEVRREGRQAASLIQTLDQSHLVRQILALYSLRS